MADIPKVIATSEINLGGFIMHVHVLDNGQRVIDAEDVERFFSPDSGIGLSSEMAEQIAKALRA